MFVFYKKPDGSVIGKLKNAPNKVFKEMKEKGYKECDEYGNILKATPKSKPKKKKK